MFTLRSTITTLLATLVLFTSSAINALGPTIELHHTVEEARISVTANTDDLSGSVTAKLLECNGCEPVTYNYDASTVFINALGAPKPIDELKTWSGNRAMFHFRKADKYIEQIQILP